MRSFWWRQVELYSGELAPTLLPDQGHQPAHCKPLCQCWRKVSPLASDCPIFFCHLQLLEGFYRPESGSVLLDGVPVHEIEPHWFHQKVRRTTQGA